MALRPVSMVHRTTSSVAYLPLGRTPRSKTPFRSGSTFSRSRPLRLWRPQQCVSNSSFPCAIAFIRRLAEYEQADNAGKKRTEAKGQISVGLRVEQNMGFR
jgi:hypothetical protein